MTRLLWQAVGLTLALAACSDTGTVILPTETSDRVSPGVALRAVDGRGHSLYAYRPDGDARSLFEISVLPDVPGTQPVVLTGFGAGEDQGSLIVLDSVGAIALRHRVGGTAPDWLVRDGAGTPVGHRLLVPMSSRPVVLDHDGRRLLLVATAGMWAPYTFEVLEIGSGSRPKPLFRFWNAGAVQTPRYDERSGYLVVQAVNNTFREKREGHPDMYPVAVAVFTIGRLLELAANDPEITATGWGPGLRAEGRPDVLPPYMRYYVLPELQGPDRRADLGFRVDGDVVRVDVSAGLSYVLDPRSGTFDVEASSVYRDLHAELRTHRPEMLELDEEIERALDRVRVFPPRSE